MSVFFYSLFFIINISTNTQCDHLNPVSCPHLSLCSSLALGPGWIRRTSETPWRLPGSGGCFWRPQICGRLHAGTRAHLSRPASGRANSVRWSPGRSGWTPRTPRCSACGTLRIKPRKNLFHWERNVFVLIKAAVCILWSRNMLL